MSGLPTLGRRLTAGVVAWSLLAAQSQALTAPNLHMGDNKAAVAVCAAEREPLLELQQEYTSVRRAKLNGALTAGAKAGLMLLLSANPMLAMAANAAKHSGMMGQPQQGGSNPNDPNNAMLTEALTLKIPGVDPPPSTGEPSGKMTQLVRLVQPGAPVNDNSARTLLAISMVAAISGQTDVYIKVKQQQYSNDPQRISQSVESDAGTQVPVGVQSAALMKTLADCREKQVADYRDKLTGASDKDKKGLLRGQVGLKSVVTADLDLINDITINEATVARVLTQGRAMAEGRSEADVLRPQAPAYSAEASTQVWQLPPLETAAGTAPAQLGPPKIAKVTLRATVLRSTPDPKGAVVMHLAAGHSLTPARRASADASWWEIDVAGSLAYVRDADLADPGSVAVAAATPPKGKGRGKAGVPPPPAAPPASNIRSLNSQVIAVKSSGADRLKTLADSIEVAGA